MPGLHGRDDRLQGPRIVRIAGEHLVAKGKTVKGDDKRDQHLLAVGAMAGAATKRLPNSSSLCASWAKSAHSAECGRNNGSANGCCLCGAQRMSSLPPPGDSCCAEMVATILRLNHGFPEFP
jgi:hypothetical protein